MAFQRASDDLLALCASAEEHCADLDFQVDRRVYCNTINRAAYATHPSHPSHSDTLLSAFYVYKQSTLKTL